MTISFLDGYLNGSKSDHHQMEASGERETLHSDSADDGTKGSCVYGEIDNFFSFC